MPSQKVTAIDSVHPLAAAVENLFGTQTKRWFCVTVHGHAVVKEPQMDADQRRWSARAFRRLHTILSGDRFGIYDHCLETDPVDAFQLSEEILVPSFPDSCF